MEFSGVSDRLELDRHELLGCLDLKLLGSTRLLDRDEKLEIDIKLRSEILGSRST